MPLQKKSVPSCHIRTLNYLNYMTQKQYQTDKNYALIMAGGKGRRLWPCSREQKPKQFMDLFSRGRTLLQSTYDRVSGVIPPQNIFISTNVEYVDFVRNQIPDIPEENILAEPIFRGTAPSVGWAAFRISHLCDNPSLVIIPSDQEMFDVDRFHDTLRKGLEFVSTHDNLLAVGVKPTRPETGYGYIQIGKETDTDGIQGVKSFTEKPGEEFAKLFMESGEFLWNTGIYMGNARHLCELIGKVLPLVLRKIDVNHLQWSLELELETIQNSFPVYPNVAIERGILENNSSACLICGDFGWVDLGTWNSIYDARSNSSKENVVIDSKVIMDNCHGNIVRLPGDHLCILNGLEGYIVAENGNVLLICPREGSDKLIRKYINDAKLQFDEKYI